MTTRKTEVDYYTLNVKKKSICSFFNFLIKRPNGLIHRLTEEILKTININDSDLNFLIDFSKNSGILKTENSNYYSFITKSEDDLFIDFCKYYFFSITHDRNIYEKIFLKSELTLDNDYLVLNLKSIDLNYAPIITTLSLLGFVEYKNDKVFIKNYLLAKKLIERPLKKLKLSQKEYEKELFDRSERGKYAEVFVLNYEIKKLKKTGLFPYRISLDDVGKGYDIESYDLNRNKIFIEVKSISNNRFYWSENEIETSKKLKEKYFIYCVKFKDGSPHSIKYIIDNPFDKIFIKKEYDFKTINDHIIYLKP